ncbi:hypothetical protein BamIOP4010DRAFT_3631 [Burkholderia ambifaria IOP40-10]|uniref:Uncharacterized protein n=1 Tax=Burkholderia ambifaria IOP40-10 TaxID=396596 RepID=B1FHX1_9BURK|nr:hypothetical protein BamIOP4010DRAFT_3631 [Burkholderia ambifaria IOP40-10]
MLGLFALRAASVVAVTRVTWPLEDAFDAAAGCVRSFDRSVVLRGCRDFYSACALLSPSHPGQFLYRNCLRRIEEISNRCRENHWQHGGRVGWRDGLALVALARCLNRCSAWSDVDATHAFVELMLAVSGDSNQLVASSGGQFLRRNWLTVLMSRPVTAIGGMVLGSRRGRCCEDTATTPSFYIETGSCDGPRDEVRSGPGAQLPWRMRRAWRPAQSPLKKDLDCRWRPPNE